MKLSYSNGNEWLKILLYSIISVYIVYHQSTNADAITLDAMIVRHQRMLEVNSEFFNPWQYRILSTYIAEIFTHTLQLVMPSMGYGAAFILLRLLQNILIFILADLYFKKLGILNPWLRLYGILTVGFCMAHSVFASDLSLNTYFDIIFYLTAVLLILYKKYVWIIPLSFFASLNRETSALIPAMLVIPAIDWKNRTIDRKILMIGIASGVAFVIAFVGVRLYFGYQPAIGIEGMTSVKDFWWFNITFKRMYLQMIGTLGFLPIVTILFLGKLSPQLRIWFWIMVPIWFIIHFSYSSVVESRLFLVPQVLIFVPAFLQIINSWYSEKNSATLS